MEWFQIDKDDLSWLSIIGEDELEESEEFDNSDIDWLENFAG